ncbi:N-substituted formamide deformylase precursor [Brevundimonas sp. SH203]|uniref:amidohydrolase n=1 Tax=Brevundimonas sp. SH203 TaxID=345167 RepID=UPI0009CF4B23|nr:amidohydrolase [Brevundimonas sp. SH203]GAW40963.1 N-substituted formamide deformylase precursor [Brevundimonas sp. SH203]
MAPLTIFRARRIWTMDAANPAVTHVAVKDGRIVAVGDADQAQGWQGVRDDRYADQFLLPGFVEAHAHVMAGPIWRYPYVGPADRMDDQGRLWPATRSMDAVLDRLKAAEPALAPGAPLIGWGFDPLFVEGAVADRGLLDAVSTTRPVVLHHSNGHLITVNSAALALAGYDSTTRVTGVAMDAKGEPTGELREFAAMMPVLRRLGVDLADIGRGEDALRRFASLARRAGVTTIADMGRMVDEDDARETAATTSTADYPVRLAVVTMGMFSPVADIIARVERLASFAHDKLHFCGVKLMIDGSIQGYTAKLRPPGYHRGEDHGIWNMAPQQLIQTVEALHAAGLQIHVHANGDLATDAALDAFEAAVSAQPRRDHRHVIQHAQMADTAQFERMARLGVSANLFANHLYYFGDQHHDLTIGPQRAARLNDGRAALDAGVPLSLHSDAPVTPLAPLVTAWCAVNRRTESGRILGGERALTVAEALEAVTLGAARSLKLDHEIGSLTPGKRADMVALNDDPFHVPPEDIRDIAVTDTALGGISTAQGAR